VAALAFRLPARLAAMLTAFGGGILMSAVALELVPQADAEAGPVLATAGLIGGMVVFVSIDAWLGRDEDVRMMREAGQAAAAGRPMSMPTSPDAVRGESLAAGLFVDGVPESLALGLTVATGEVGFALLAGILVGNVVESYGATQAILSGERSRRFPVVLMTVIGAALAGSTVLGGSLLAGASADMVGTAQAFAAGAVLAVLTITIIPHAFDEVNRAVAAATVLGFVAGYLLST